MLKKFIALMCSVLFTLTSLNIIFAEDMITVRVNCKEIYSDQSPIVENGEILVPFRAFAEEMGFYVEWDYVCKIAKIHTDDRKFTILVWLDQNTANYGDIELLLGDTEENTKRRRINNDVSARIVNERILVPINPVAEVLGAEVKWETDSGIAEVERIIENTELYEKGLERFAEEDRKQKEEEEERQKAYLNLDKSKLEEVYKEFMIMVGAIDKNKDKLSKKAIENFESILENISNEESKWSAIRTPSQEDIDKVMELFKKYLQELKDFAKENGIDMK